MDLKEKPLGIRLRMSPRQSSSSKTLSVFRPYNGVSGMRNQIRKCCGSFHQKANCNTGAGHLPVKQGQQTAWAPEALGNRDCSCSYKHGAPTQAWQDPPASTPR